MANQQQSFFEPLLVKCPLCGNGAVLRYENHWPRLSCIHCGHARRGEEQAGRGPGPHGFADGATIWGLQLLLTGECCNEKLWAHNEFHLDYLMRFVASTDRDRDFPSPPGNRGLAYKLPKWMQLAANREEILRCGDRLRQRLRSSSAPVA